MFWGKWNNEITIIWYFVLLWCCYDSNYWIANLTCRCIFLYEAVICFRYERMILLRIQFKFREMELITSKKKPLVLGNWWKHQAIVDISTYGFLSIEYVRLHILCACFHDFFFVFPFQIHIAFFTWECCRFGANDKLFRRIRSTHQLQYI